MSAALQLLRKYRPQFWCSS